MKLRPVGAELFHTDGQTDMTKLIIAFHNFANASKNGKLWLNKGNTNYSKDTFQQEAYQERHKSKHSFL